MKSESEPALPKAEIRTRRSRFPLIWIVPLVATVLAASLIYDRVSDRGPEITIRFETGLGIREGVTPVRFRGVTIGEVRDVSLASGNDGVLIKARMTKSGAEVARIGSVFWVVRPEVSMGNVAGLGTLLSGPFIQVQPGTGEPSRDFIGMPKAPVTHEGQGLQLLLTSRSVSLQPGAAVTYRGIEVGVVQASYLSTNSSIVMTEIFITKRYVPLIRTGTRFWSKSGLDVNFSLFKGAEINVDSLKALMVGGLTFATPDEGKGLETVSKGHIFPLLDEPKKEWLEWNPQIPLDPEE